MKFILASASPRRAQLLTEAGYDFDIIPADVDEKQVPLVSPSEVAQRLAILKAETVSAIHADDVTLAADTVVCLGERILGKPQDANEAREMLELLSGTTQIVITGFCVMRPAGQFMHSGRAMTAVRMDRLTRGQIDQYVASNQWQGKAGGYGIQDNDPFVKRISGSHSNVVGLPMEMITQALSRAGIEPKSKA